MSTSPGPSASISTPTVVITDRLQSAAAQGHLDVLRKLVESGATLHPDKEGRTALHFAALNGHVDVCEFLVEHGCETNVQDAVGYSALHRAASHGNQKIMELLLKKGCAMDTQDENGNAAIHEAAWNGFSQTLDLLIKYNCNIQISNKAGFTALHLSAQNGHNQSTRVLLLAGCNSDLKNNYGDTALHTAARYGHAGVTRILISARCSLNEQNKNGDTALHIAAALKRRKIAKLLVDAGIDVYIKNKQNETAIEVACRKEHQEIIDIINSFSRPKTPKNANPKVVNFKDVPVDIIEGPMVVPDETTAKPEKQERKFFDFFKKKKKDKDKDVTDKAQMLGQVRSPDPAVQGFFSQYIPRPGIQYYRDLAGNIKQGPIGYTPICQCMPTLKKLEHTVHTNKESLYDHIEASNRALCHRMDQLDKRTMDQVGSIDHLTKERLAEEERNCQNRIEQRMEEEREYLRANYQQNMQLGVEDWLEAKLSTYGHCLDHHHDDTALPNNNIFTDIHHTENGRLFKSRSDETLSQSDNHSGKFRKKEFYESRQAAMQQIRAWQVPNYKQERSHSRDVNDNVKSANYRQTSQLPPQPYRGQNSYNQNLHTSHRNIDRNDFTAHSQMSNRNEPVRRNNENFSSKQDILSPSTNSTVKSPHSQQANDSNYGHYGHQGAIPKRLPTSQTWHNTEQWRREASPATQNATKVLDQNSHKSSPHGQVISKGMVRSRTENEGFIRKLNQRDVPQREQFQRHAAPRQSAPERCLSNTQESGKGRTGAQMFNKNNDARQSFQERGSSNTNTGTNSANMTSSVVPGAGLGPQESNSRPSSGKSEDKSDCHYNTKPTFTTFGYEEKKLPDNVLQNTNSPNNTISVQPGSSVEKETPYIYPIKRSKTPNNELEKSTPHDGQSLYGYFISKGEQSKFTPGQHSRAVSQPRNQDNAYMTMSSKPMLRQRTRSSDGILDDTLTSAHDLVKRSASKERNFNTTHQISQRPRSQTSQTPKSLSENHSPLQNTPGDNVNHSAVYRNNSNNPNTLHSGYPVVPKKPSIQIPNTQQYSNNDSQNKNTPVANSSNNVYVQMKTPVTNDTRYHMHGLVQELQLRSKDGGQGLRENPYSSVRNVSQYTADVQYSKQGQTHHSSYNVNYVGQSERPQYCESSPIVKSFSKSEPNLDRSLNDSNDHDPGYTSPVSPRGDYSTCQIPTGEFSANKDNRKIVANYPNAYNKEDSSSNPDSGYSSKIFGSRSHQSNVPSNSGTPSSSFCTDHDNSMSIPSNNNSPHPQISHSDYELIKNVQNSAQKTAQNQNLQSHVNSWYQQKLQQAAQRLRDGPYTSNQGDSPPCQPKHNQYQYSQTSDLYNNQSQYATSNYPSNKDYVTNNYQRIFIRGSDV